MKEQKTKENSNPSQVGGKLQPLKLSLREVLVFIFIMLCSCAVLFAFFKIRDANKRTERIIGTYKVIASKAYFYDEPKSTKRREDFIIPSDEKIIIYDRKGDYLFTEIEDDNGELLRGWLNKKSLHLFY